MYHNASDYSLVTFFYMMPCIQCSYSRLEQVCNKLEACKDRKSKLVVTVCPLLAYQQDGWLSAQTDVMSHILTVTVIHPLCTIVHHHSA